MNNEIVLIVLKQLHIVIKWYYCKFNAICLYLNNLFC